MRGLVAGIHALILAVGAAAAEVPESRAEISLSFAPVVEQAAPAVVNIYTRRVVGADSPFAGSRFEDMMRGMGRTVPQVQNALGSGVILTAGGLVMTNYHIAGEADEITIVLADRREFSAEIVLAEERTDLALLRIDGDPELAHLPLAPRGALDVGDLVLAVGNPFGIGQTVSSGIVSALARTGLPVGSGEGFYIQTDAAINPGNSGGALIDLEGRLVGVNTAIFSRSGGSNGIGFAIPAALISEFLDQARAGESRFRRPWGGIMAQAVDADMANGLGLDRPRGVILRRFGPASPFREAGLALGDVILSVEGTEVNTPQGLLFQMEIAGIGGELSMRVRQDGSTHRVTVAMIAPPERPPSAPVTIADERPFAGLSGVRINPAVMQRMKLPLNADGVVVTEPGTLGRRIGLEPGDIMRRINGADIATTEDLQREAGKRRARWEVTFERGGDRKTVRFRL